MARPNEVTVWIRAKDLASRVVQGFTTRLRAVQRVSLGVTKAVVGIGAAIFALEKLAERGGRVVGVQRAFAKATGDATGALLTLRTASQGLIRDFELMVGFNKALALGAADTVEEFGGILRATQDLSRALGIDATFALEKLSLGLARQSPKLLDDVGIKVSARRANEEYAESIGRSAASLNDEERALAFRSAALREADRLVKELGGSQIEAADAGQRFNQTIQNSIDRIASLVATSPSVRAFFDTMADAIERTFGGDPISRRIREDVERLGSDDLAAALGPSVAAFEAAETRLSKARAAVEGEAERLRTSRREGEGIGRLLDLTGDLDAAERQLTDAEARLGAILKRLKGLKVDPEDVGPPGPTSSPLSLASLVAELPSDADIFGELTRRREKARASLSSLEIDVVLFEAKLSGLAEGSEAFSEMEEKITKTRASVRDAKAEVEALTGLLANVEAPTFDPVRLSIDGDALLADVAAQRDEAVRRIRGIRGELLVVEIELGGVERGTEAFAGLTARAEVLRDNLAAARLEAAELGRAGVRDIGAQRDEALRLVRSLSRAVVRVEVELEGMDEGSEGFRVLSARAEELRDNLAAARLEAVELGRTGGRALVRDIGAQRDEALRLVRSLSRAVVRVEVELEGMDEGSEGFRVLSGRAEELRTELGGARAEARELGTQLAEVRAQARLVDPDPLARLRELETKAIESSQQLAVELFAIEGQLAGMDAGGDAFASLSTRASDLRDRLAEARSEAEALSTLAHERALTTISAFDPRGLEPVGAAPPPSLGRGQLGGPGDEGEAIGSAFRRSGLSLGEFQEASPEQFQQLRDAAALMGQSVEQFLGSLEGGTQRLGGAGDAAVASFGSMAQAALEGSDQMAVVVINSFNRILQSVQGIGGSLFGGILGVGLGLATSLFSRGSRSGPVAVSVRDFGNAAERQLRGRGDGPENITIQVFSPITGEIIDNVTVRIRDNERRDAIRRIAPGSGVVSTTGGPS